MLRSTTFLLTVLANKYIQPALMMWYWDMVVVLAVLGSVTDAEKERQL